MSFKTILPTIPFLTRNIGTSILASSFEPFPKSFYPHSGKKELVKYFIILQNDHMVEYSEYLAATKMRTLIV